MVARKRSQQSLNKYILCKHSQAISQIRLMFSMHAHTHTRSHTHLHTHKHSLSHTPQLHGVYQSAPMVDYEYYLTASQDSDAGMHGNHTVDIDDSLTDPGSEYAWKYKPFSECSVTCGTGVAIAMAMCEDLKHPGRDLPDNLCRRNLETVKPLPIVQKCFLHKCQPE